MPKAKSDNVTMYQHPRRVMPKYRDPETEAQSEQRRKANETDLYYREMLLKNPLNNRASSKGANHYQRALGGRKIV